jgi:hypothetical protein
VAGNSGGRKVFLTPLVLFALMSMSNGQGEDYSTWGHKKSITINTSSSGYAISERLTNFPYLVRLTAADSVFIQSSSPSGGDIRFAKSDGVTPLAYEIESWDAAAKTAAIWVQVDQIIANNASQSIMMLWGKSGVTSRSNGKTVFALAGKHIAVWHFSTGDPLGDATPNALTLTDNGTSEAQSSIIGGGRNLPGMSGTSLSHANDAHLSITDSLTISAWVKSTDASADGKVMGKTTWPPKGYLMGVNANGMDAEVWDTSGTDFRPSGGTIMSNKWVYIAVTYAVGGQMICYVNGSAVKSIPASAMPIGTNADPFYIGRPGWDGSQLLFSGVIDEARLCRTVRSANWIKLSYLNQRIVPGAAPTIKYPKKSIFIPVNTFTDSIKPVITGELDSLIIDPPLPNSLIFNPQNGVITGSANDFTYNAPFCVTAYNELGSGSDTFHLTIDNPTSTVEGARSASATPMMIGLGKSGPVRLYFSIPASTRASDLLFTLYNIKGAEVWSSHYADQQISTGIQSIAMNEDGTRIPNGTYFITMKVDAQGVNSGAIQRMKIAIIR